MHLFLCQLSYQSLTWWLCNSKGLRMSCDWSDTDRQARKQYKALISYRVYEESVNIDAAPVTGAFLTQRNKEFEPMHRSDKPQSYQHLKQ